MSKQDAEQYERMYTLSGWKVLDLSNNTFCTKGYTGETGAGFTASLARMFNDGNTMALKRFNTNYYEV